MLRHTNPIKNVEARSCTSVKIKVTCFLLEVSVNHFRVHNLQKSHDTLTDPIAFLNLVIFSNFYISCIIMKLFDD